MLTCDAHVTRSLDLCLKDTPSMVLIHCVSNKLVNILLIDTGNDRRDLNLNAEMFLLF